MQATFCPCVLYGNNRRRFEHLHYKGFPHPTLAATKHQLHCHKDGQDEEQPQPASRSKPCCFSAEDDPAHEEHAEEDDRDEGESRFFSPPCLTHALLLPCGIGLVLQAMFRGKIRKRYRIRGEVYEDGLAAFCCGPCQLVQESRELEVEERTFVLKPVDVRSAKPSRKFMF